jgi:hypothetical protein
MMVASGEWRQQNDKRKSGARFLHQSLLVIRFSVATTMHDSSRGPRNRVFPVTKIT